jgi:putative thioredoxin
MDNQSLIFDTTPDNFQDTVITRSQQIPVLVLFWAAQVDPSAEAKTTLESLVNAQAGKIALALVDVSIDQTLAQHLRVQGLPSLRVVRDGQLVDQLEGPQTAQALTELVDQLTLSSADVLKAQLEGLLAAGDFDSALQLLQQAVNEEPKNMSFRVELADVLVRQQQFDDAKTVLAGIPEDTEDRDRPATRLELCLEAVELPELAQLQASVDQLPDELEGVYQLAVKSAAAGDFATALELAMSILQRDRKFRDDLGRLTMLRFFSVLGKGSDLATSYRRRMFNFMH